MSDIQKFERPALVTERHIVPGTPYYEWLAKQVSPAKLKRMVSDDKNLYMKTHALEWPEECRSRHAQAEAIMARTRYKGNDGKLLGLNTIDRPLTKRDVKNAYRRAARRLHPDAGGSEEAFKQLHEAYRRVLAASVCCFLRGGMLY